MMLEGQGFRGWSKAAAAIAGLLLFQTLALWAMGRVPICECGYVKLWHGVVQSSENSQHISDWYSSSHVIHGVLFYAGFHFLMPRTPVALRFVLAMAIEVSWEILENTDAVINRYREATISLDYFGDSIVNSVSDSLFALLGFVLAATLPVWAVVLMVIVFEAGTAYMIRDNLLLNIVMLLWPLDAIREWQAGG